uniref:Uncharacterized protein n=1 Tax=Tanacetum cinerariifolium TaxID=118510 RepID=A0A6L2KUQ8_TANCI|nr:hypothetical protein [Tanacetum cinerariifolium]
MESTTRNVPVKTTNSSALVSCDGFGGYDWSDQAEDGLNYALMAYSTSSSDSEMSELMVLGYKLGLESIEERLKFFKTNESIYIEDIKLLKVEIQMKDIAIKELRRKLEVALKEKDGIQLTVEKLENASKSLNKLIDSQIVDNCKKGLEYNAVPPPHTGLFMPPKPDLSYIGLEEFTNEPAVETLNAKTSEDVPKVVKNDNGAPIIEDWKLDSEDEDESMPKIKKKTVKPSVLRQYTLPFTSDRTETLKAKRSSMVRLDSFSCIRSSSISSMSWSNDPPLGVYITSRLPVNSKTIELLTFTSLARNSPKGVLVIVYWLLCCILAARGTSPKILEVVVDEVYKWNDKVTSVIRILHEPFINSEVGPARSSGVSVSTLSRFIIKLEKSNRLARYCSNHDPELDFFMAERTIQDAEKIEQ